ncbi:MAG: 16S rRNA (adenine(1518)-N(6)/adenine(1519)-N(6))-dimethyltransferase RsmA [Ruminococcaceae bacterium]|nr:16S rRNA (adenine(1518)-N(6)/adenine(1519)-N(6))-dimethyltransferase RsmA [Oscillospiraceae bacterium]
MQNLSDINQIKKILSKHGFSLSKSLGQNFIIDDSVCPRMAEEAVFNDNIGVIEIGPGIGVLTVELAKRAKKVVTIELDERLLPILNETLEDYDNIVLIHGDVLKINFQKIIEENLKGMQIVVCANLPYYITSPIIMKLLEKKLPIETIVVMVQAEAADRLCANVGTRKAGAVTVAVNFYATVKELFFVSKEAFMPSPKVDSKVIRLLIKKDPINIVKNEKDFFSMIKMGFSKRRKTILNSLISDKISKEKLEATLDELKISKTSRIEQLSMNELITIFNKLY